MQQQLHTKNEIDIKNERTKINKLFKLKQDPSEVSKETS